MDSLKPMCLVEEDLELSLEGFLVMALLQPLKSCTEKEDMEKESSDQRYILSSIPSFISFVRYISMLPYVYDYTGGLTKSIE